jgi:hypothetical protein
MFELQYIYNSCHLQIQSNINAYRLFLNFKAKIAPVSEVHIDLIVHYSKYLVGLLFK